MPSASLFQMPAMGEVGSSLHGVSPTSILFLGECVLKRFGTPLLRRPKLGDRVSCWVLVSKDINPSGWIYRCGSIVQFLTGHKVFCIQDEVSDELIWAHQNMCFKPTDFDDSQEFQGSVF